MASEMVNSSDFCHFAEADHDWKSIFSYYLNGPLLSFLILVGTVGNISSLLALTRPKRLPQINQYLIALSVWDTILIVSAFFVYNLPYLMDGHIVTHGSYVLMYPLCFMLSCASHMGGIWMVMISAIDRYFALCRPMTHRLYIGGENRTKTILLACSLACLMYNAPRYLEMTVDECYDPGAKIWIPSLSGHGLRTKPVYWICYKIIGGILFFSAVPFAALTYLSLRVSYEVRRLTSTRQVPVKPALKSAHANSPSPTPSTLMPPSSDPEKRVSFSDTVIEYESRNGVTKTSSTLRRHSTKIKRSGDDPQNALNFMLVAVLLKFLVCHSLPTILDVWESSTGENFEGPLIDVLVDASNVLVVVNSSVNVFIYLWCSRRFRYDMSKVAKKFMDLINCGDKEKQVKNGPIKFRDPRCYGMRNYRNGMHLCSLKSASVCSSSVNLVIH